MTREEELFAQRMEDARVIGSLRAKLQMVVEYAGQLAACDDPELKRTFERAMRIYTDHLRTDPEVFGAEEKREKEVVA